MCSSSSSQNRLRRDWKEKKGEKEKPQLINRMLEIKKLENQTIELLLYVWKEKVVAISEMTMMWI